MRTHDDLSKEIAQTLLTVSRPARYAGGELHVVRKNPADQRVSICLAFPDVYDIGQSYIGFHILYHILNGRPGTLCERTFAPWPDMETAIRERELPLWSLENQLPVSSFDIVGFTLQYELHYTTVLNMLDLSGIPLYARDRGDSDPLVIGGGTCSSNPEPVADFFDAILIGDGEEAFPEMAAVVERSRAEGISRAETLLKLAEIEGVYVPSLYKPKYEEDGAYAGIEPIDSYASLPVHARIVKEMKPEYYPDKPLVPVCEVVHDRLAIEIMRGCTRGCRFCAAGMTYRPQRTRTVQDVVNQAVQGIRATGWDEISLVSLSTTDYPGLETAVKEIGATLGGNRVSISLSSLRADNFSLRMAAATGGGRKTGLTFAPEAGTQRLRDVINKNLTEEQLIGTVTAALEEGWKSIKLYFMIGLPTETDEDIAAIPVILNTVGDLMKKHHGKRVTVTISPFSPKPVTPFQWEPQDSVESIRRKIALIHAGTRSRMVQIKTGNPLLSMLECRLARGDRRMSALIEEAWRAGSRLDGWSEHFNSDIWRHVFGDRGITLEDGGGAIKPGSPIPWGHLHNGVDERYLLDQREQAFAGETTPDCIGPGACNHCGPYAAFCNSLKSKRAAEQPVAPSVPTEKEPAAVSDSRFGRKRKPIKSAAPSVLTGTRFRIRYSKTGPARYAGHLDLVRVFDRTMRRAGIPIAYSQGFHPHPKISFGPPLPLGMESRAEFVDISLEKPYSAIDAALQRGLPEGLAIMQIRPIPDRTDSLVQVITAARYDVRCTVDSRLTDAIQDILDRDSITVTRRTKNGDREKDIRTGIREITVSDDRLGFTMLLSLEEQTMVKPVEVLGLLFEQESAEVTRTEQFVETGGSLVSPIDIIW